MDYKEEPLSVGQCLLTLIVLAIPCIGIIMTFIWAFGNGNQTRKNLCRAELIIVLVGFVITFLLALCMGANVTDIANKLK